MRQRIRHLFSILMVCAMVLSLLPISALADESGNTTPTEGSEVINPAGEPAPRAETVIYVSASGDDSKNGTSEENAVATLAEAVKIAPDGAIIYVMSNLTINDLARVTDKHVTITSATGEGSPYSLCHSLHCILYDNSGN